MSAVHKIVDHIPAQKRERKRCTLKHRWSTACCLLVWSIYCFHVISFGGAFIPVSTKTRSSVHAPTPSVERSSRILPNHDKRALPVNFMRTRCMSLKLRAIDNANGHVDDGCPREEVLWNRRRTTILASSSLVAQLVVGYRAPSNAATEPVDGATTATTDSTLDVNFDCLQDLPPIPKDCVRIYLCRHGQTENNRLRKVQGARVDPPINDNGIAQATNLGKTLSQVQPCPNMVVHSSLLRAKMTAETAAKQMDASVTTTIIPALGEVDFGPVAEGQPVAMAKAGMQLTYGAWALGNIDYRPDQGGETGREVITRAAEALTELAKEAKKSNGCIVAVSHSTYLRILLAAVLDEPLLETAVRNVNNGSITVIDVNKDLSPRSSRKITMTSKMFSGPGGVVQKRPSQVEEFELKLPVCNVVRINEVRHLPVL